MGTTRRLKIVTDDIGGALSESPTSCRGQNISLLNPRKATLALASGGKDDISYFEGFVHVNHEWTARVKNVG